MSISDEGGAVDESRRSLIKRAAAGAGVVWATPVITSLATPAVAGTPAPTTTSPTTTPPPPCDCDHPEPTGRSVTCQTIGCPPTKYICPVIEPCDSVSLGCGSGIVLCGWTFTASCSSVPGSTGGIVTSVLGLLCNVIGIHPGNVVQFDYQIG